MDNNGMAQVGEFANKLMEFAQQEGVEPSILVTAASMLIGGAYASILVTKGEEAAEDLVTKMINVWRSSAQAAKSFMGNVGSVGHA